MPTIHTINIDGVEYDVKSTHFAVCSTSAGVAAKTATIQNGNFTLGIGVKVSVKFTNANTASSPSLSINSTATKPIRYGSSFPAAQSWIAGQVVEFVFDGTAWQVVGIIKDNNTNTTYPILNSNVDNNGKFLSVVEGNPTWVNSPSVDISWGSWD